MSNQADGFTLRPLSLDDVSRLAELEEQLFSDESPWSPNQIAAVIVHPTTVSFAYENPDGVLCGFAMLGFRGTPEDAEFELLNIAVDPTYQGHGIGTVLMNNVVRIADDYSAPIFLEVRIDNDPAIHVYEKFGFRRIGIRRGYYEPAGIDALTMTRDATVDDR